MKRFIVNWLSIVLDLDSGMPQSFSYVSIDWERLCIEKRLRVFLGFHFVILIFLLIYCVFKLCYNRLGCSAADELMLMFVVYINDAWELLILGIIVVGCRCHKCCSLWAGFKISVHWWFEYWYQWFEVKGMCCSFYRRNMSFEAARIEQYWYGINGW